MENNSVISKIINYLHVDEEVDVLTLLSKLRDEMRIWHPDKAPQGTEEYKVYEEKFKELSSLSKELKGYISDNKKSVVKADKSDDNKIKLATITDQINDLEKSEMQSQKINTLSSLNESYKIEIETLKAQNSELKQKLENRNNEMSKEEREELIQLFSVSHKQVIGGWLSFFGLLSTFIPQVHDFLTEQLDVMGQRLIVFLWCVVVLSIIHFIYKKIQKCVLNNSIEYMTDPNNIKELVPTKTSSSIRYYADEYVSYSDIQSGVRRYLHKPLYKLFFIFDFNKAVNVVTRNIIAHFLRFDIFKDKKTNEFDVLFCVNKTSVY